MRDREGLLVRIGGLVACAMVGFPLWPALAEGQLSARVTFLGLGGLALFALLFWWLTGGREPRPRGVQLGIVTVQILLALGLTVLLDYTLTGILLVLTAAALGSILPLRPALLWVAAQTVGYGWIASLVFNSGVPVVVTLSFAGFQLFALHSAATARREREAREELARAHAEVLATRQLLEDSSRAAERVRISRELHDVMGHHLAALSLSLEAARHAPPEETSRHVETAQSLTRRMLREVRRVVSRLREATPVDLAGALATLAAGTGRPEVHLTIPEELRIDDPERAHALLRCAQEALTNAIRHAGAKNVWIELTQGPQEIELRARDDGRGAATIQAGNGLLGMRERLEKLGGQLAVDSAPGHGFAVTARVPLSPLGAAVP
ncbi:MAG TPA: sensor histidine kinase [Thermoanaerobaculia bacterium]|nr:sensor histidine kinase [Thermoanaerobaculia bacterium]